MKKILKYLIVVSALLTGSFTDSFADSGWRTVDVKVNLGERLGINLSSVFPKGTEIVLAVSQPGKELSGRYLGAVSMFVIDNIHAEDQGDYYFGCWEKGVLVFKLIVYVTVVNPFVEDISTIKNKSLIFQKSVLLKPEEISIC